MEFEASSLRQTQASIGSGSRARGSSSSKIRIPRGISVIIAGTVSGNYLEHGVRINSVFTSYRISGTSFSQRLGNLAGPTDVEKTS